MKQKTLFIGMLLLASILPGFSQQTETAMFKFSAHSNMFFLRDNETELERLYDFIDLHRGEIAEGQLPVRVDGYCASFDNRAENLKTAAVRSNRVKSELIVRKGLKESHFITRNFAESYEGRKDIVVVSFISKEIEALEEVKEVKETKEVAEVKEPQPETVVEQPEKEVVEQVQPAPEKIEEQATFKTEDPTTTVVSQYSKFSVRTNLLYWAVATPNLGVEYRFNKGAYPFAVLVNGAFSHWIWSDKDKHHRTWMVQPELRWYLGENKNWFAGLEGHIGQFNLKFKDTGYQGDAIGGGLTGGYRLRLSRMFDMDFSLGLGYTSLKYESYYRSNGVMVRKESGLSKNVFAPTQAGVSLIWKIK